MGRRVKDEGGSEGRSGIERIGVEPPARSPHAKAGRLPSGVSARDRPTNWLGRQSRGQQLAAGAASGGFRSSAPDQYRAGGAHVPHRVPRGALRET